ncbi:MAG: class I SAM-dependent methyltransferase [Patescibacteria group bacterium]
MENHLKKIDTTCIACGERLFDFFANKNDFNLYRCKNCHLIFVWPLPKESANLYSSDYFSGAKHGFGYVNYEEDKSAMFKTFEVYLGKIEQFMPRKGKLLDVGAATGFFVQLATARGWKASGIEISDYAAKVARQKGLDVMTGTLESVDFDTSSFSVVTLWDVIEHLPDPVSHLKLIYNILEVGGLVAINTPDSASFVARIFGKRWHLLVPPEHLFYFNYRSLSVLLRNSGFEVVHISKIGKKFTLQYIFKTLARWQNFFIWRQLAEFFAKTQLVRFSIPINLRDNFFIIAKKL